MFATLRRAARLRQLQLKIAPKLNMEDIGSHEFMEQVFASHDKELEEYLDLCVQDKEVASIMAQHSLTRKDLVDIKNQITRDWAGDYHVPLSTIAYPETLLYYMQAKQTGKSDLQIDYELQQYWGHNVPLSYPLGAIKKSALSFYYVLIGYLIVTIIWAYFICLPLAGAVGYGVCSGLLFFIFLDVLNRYLRGYLKQKIDCFTGVVVMGLILYIFISAGWQYGFLALLFGWLAARITTPIALIITHKTLFRKDVPKS